MIPAAFIGFIVLIAAGLIGYFTETKRVGGIRFWRLGPAATHTQSGVDRLGSWPYNTYINNTHRSPK